MTWDSEYRRIKGITVRQVTGQRYSWKLPSGCVYQLDTRTGSVTCDGDEVTRGRYDVYWAVSWTQGYETAMWELCRQAGRAQKAGCPIGNDGVMKHLLDAIERQVRP
jgi:hypothetical protein